MSDYPPPGFAPDAAVAGGPALTPEAIAAALEDFRAWLTDAAASGRLTPADGAERSAEPRIDLSTLVAQFTALRHEVNLQTRAVRAQQEQNAETLRHLADAAESLAQAPANQGANAHCSPAPDPSSEGLLRPLLKTLVDLYDSAALAGRELQRVQETMAAALRPLEEATHDEVEARHGLLTTWWSRWFVRRRRDRDILRQRLQLTREVAGRVRQTLAATAAGYAMTLQRVERAMAQHGLEAIPAVGERFDPERMEALEVVIDGARPTGEVVDEVRRGYMWQGRVFRYAQVRVAKNNGQ